MLIEDIVPGKRAAFDFTISEDDMQKFADLSGDHNPLHTDKDFALRKGYPSAVVYGALIVAKISKLIGMHLPGRDSVWATLAIQFHHPLFVGVPACVEGEIISMSDSTRMTEIKLTVRTKLELIAKGKAEVLLVGD